MNYYKYRIYRTCTLKIPYFPFIYTLLHHLRLSYLAVYTYFTSLLYPNPYSFLPLPPTLPPIPYYQIAQRMVAIAAKEGLQLDNNAAEILVEQMGNDIRQVINCLQVLYTIHNYTIYYVLYIVLLILLILFLPLKFPFIHSHFTQFTLIFGLFCSYFAAVVTVDVACSE